MMQCNNFDLLNALEMRYSGSGYWIIIDTPSGVARSMHKQTIFFCVESAEYFVKYRKSAQRDDDSWFMSIHLLLANHSATD